MGPLFDMLYREKWSNWQNRQFFRRFFFHVFSRFGSFGVDFEKNFQPKFFYQKNLEKFKN